MLQVELNHILPESDALQKITEIIDHVEKEKEVYVLTKDGRPVVAIVNVDQLSGIEEATKPSATPAPLFGGFTAPASASDQPEVISPVVPPIPEAAPVAPIVAPSNEPALAETALPPMPTENITPSGSPLSEPLEETASDLPPLFGTEHLNKEQAPAPADSSAPQAPLPPPPGLSGFNLPKEDLGSNSPLA